MNTLSLWVTSSFVVGIVLLLLRPTSATTDVKFDSIALQPVDESGLPAAVIQQVADPKQTGNHLFNADDVDEDSRLTLNFLLTRFKSPASPYFRANPVFMRCLQMTFQHVWEKSEKVVVIRSGFKTKDEAPSGSDVQDLYARSGSGATLSYAEGSPGDVLDIAEGAIMNCPFIFSLHQRDIGLVIMADSVHVHMTGDSDKTAHYASNGYSAKDSSQFQDWCLQKIDESIDPQKTPVCGAYPSLSSGQTFPAGVTSPEAVVGSLDQRVTRDSEDFRRLVQYAGRNVKFDDSEHSAAWCGTSSNPCVDCTAGIKGHAISNSCADRMMSPRLYSRIAVLQKLVRETITGGILKVLEAWDEPYAGKPNGDQPANSLHLEGRAAILGVKSNEILQDTIKLAQLAICAQFDYVKNTGSTLIVAVKKQAAVHPAAVNFENGELLNVMPPSLKMTEHSLAPEDLDEDDDVDNYPLFDGDNQAAKKLGKHSTVSTFKSTDRYFRIVPALVRCYDAIVDYEQKWTDKAVTLTVIRAYLTASEQDEFIDAEFDERGISHRLGEAMHISYDASLHGGHFDNSSATVYSVNRIAKTAIDQCSRLLAAEERRLGIGLYSDGLFIGVRENFQMWTTEPELLPDGMNVTEYHKHLKERHSLALDGLVVDPVDPKVACDLVPEAKQSPSFRHEHSSHIQKLRRRRAAGAADDDGDDCIPENVTDFCTATAPHRKIEFDYVWEELKYQHFYHNIDEVEAALKGCLLACGMCRKGSIYEDKTEHCNNFLHWAPLPMMNEESDVTNLFYHGNLTMKTHACQGDRHCVTKSPLYAQLATSFEKLYRPDPTKSIEEELYGGKDNPLPLLELIQRLYAMHATGQVTAWVHNEVDTDYIRSSLEVAMLHNKAVTRVVVYVQDEKSIPRVEQVVGAMMGEWAATGCPLYTRDTIARAVVSKFPSGIAKRSVNEEDFAFKLSMKRANFESQWIMRTTAN